MRFWENILNIGIVDEDIPKEKKRIRLLNLVAYISIVHALFFLIFDAATGIFDMRKGVTLSTQLLLFFAIVYIQHLRQFSAARILFFLLVFVILFYHCNYAFKGFYGEYQYIVLPLISLFFFDNKYLHYTFLCLSIVAFYLPNMFFNIYPDAYFGYFNVFLLFIGLFLLVNFFKRQNETYENLLREEKDKVLKDKGLLEKQKKALDELNQFKTHFFTNISHELRTPITLIKGYASQIEINKDDKENYQNLSIIKSQANDMQHIVDSLLDLSKLDDNKLQLSFKEENIVEILNSIYDNIKKPFLDKNIDFTLEVPKLNLKVLIDKKYFIKSIQNLLSNALKFTPIGGLVSMEVLYNSGLTINITDNGIGIPKEDQKKIFGRFYQSKNHITESVGSGLGLNFAQSILKSHHFELRLNSIPNHKTTFTIYIPKEFVKTKKIPVTESKSNYDNKQIDNKKTKILVVEDNLEMRNYLKLILKDYNVIEAENGKEGLKKLESNLVDAIITDYMMPEMNGVEFVKSIKEKSIKAPIIVLTARNDDTGKLDMLRIGIDAYFTKPFIEEELLIKLKQSIYFYEQLKAYENELSLKEKLNLAKDNTFYSDLIFNINQNIVNKNFGVEQLAEEMGLSRSSLFRKTKLVLGQTPNDVIKEVRFQTAKKILIQNPSIKKKDLAEAVGIYNATYFYENLKERFNF